MKRKQFWHILRTDHAYRTPEGARLSAARLPGGATLLYYLQLIKIVWDNSLIAGSGRYDRLKWASGSVDLLHMAESAGGRVEVLGVENIGMHRQPTVFIANHMSMIDAFFLPSVILCFQDVTFVVKQSLLEYPFFGKVMEAVHPIAVKRRNPREDLKQVLTEGLRHLSQGTSVIVFPQATRSVVFDPRHFNILGVKLARKAGVPVAPVALKTDFQGSGSFFKDLGRIDPARKIHICFGAPMPVEGNGQKTHARIVEFIACHVREWGGCVRNLS